MVSTLHANDRTPEVPEPQATADTDGDPIVTVLVDARNGFNELNRANMLWTVRHLWSKGARFAFNCYKRQSRLYLRHRTSHKCSILRSKEGVTQGDPLSMVLYGLAMTPLGRRLRELHPTVTQPWYADDCSLHGRASAVRKVLIDLQFLGPSKGYFPEPDKSVLVCPQPDLTAATAQLHDLPLKHATGARYLGGFIGDKDAMSTWLEPKIAHWQQCVDQLAAAAVRFPQAAYAGMVKSLQNEWQYLQRVVPDSGPLFQPLEDTIKTKLLPALFQAEPHLVPTRSLLERPVRHAGIGIPNPVTSAPEQFAASRAVTAALSSSIQDGSPFDATVYKAGASAVRRELTAARSASHATSLQQHLATEVSTVRKRRLLRARETGLWLTLSPELLNGTDLSAEEFRDNLRLRYGQQPSNLPRRCDGCGARFSVEHALSCKKGGSSSFATMMHQRNGTPFAPMP